MCACEGSSHSLNQTRICSAVIVFVRVLLVSLCALLVQGPRSASCIPVSEFFPFGTDSDFMTERSDDGGSGRINLTVMFPFFGNRHNKIYVNNNGVISFFNELRDYRPGDFPLQDEIPIIAPYWADVDTTNSNGTVWYRESRDKDLLFKATNEIRAFPAYRNFKTYWVFVATWDEVGFFGATGEGVNKKNTFQSVLVLDTTRRLSFVILNYAN
uniref:NIDO domain-containing protein n=1 Tax=Arion vulgaris TaxID=1028688 RepID=A0A0B7AZX7_9EUPU